MRDIERTLDIDRPTGTFDTEWDGRVAKALRICAEAISKRLGYHST